MESQVIDPYEVVLADLRAKRDQLEQAIQAIENIRSGAAPASSHAPGVSQNISVDGPGAFLGMTMVEAAKKLLAAQRRPLGNADIIAGYKAGGLVMNSADPINTVGSVLTRRFSTVGDIVRVGRGVWGLAEWYPNRNFKKKGSPKGENGAEPKAATTEPEQPSTPTLDDLVN